MSELVLVPGLSILCGACVFVLAFWMFRSFNRPVANTAQQSPFNETALLFQTLRGVIHEQKTLAREFNRSVDKRIALVREVTRAFNEEREKLAEAQAEMRRLLEQCALDVQPLSEDGEAARKAVESAAEPESESEDLIDNWVGLDFPESEEVDEDEQEEEPAGAPETPEQREEARQAVNALLRGSDTSKPAGIIRPFPEVHEEGGERLSAIRSRAFDYEDAGMTVSQIAQELGIGKGEVRLMLNLREKAE